MTMVKKEERIVCCILENGYGCTYCLSKDGYQYRQCSISNYDCMYDKYGRCSLGMTRQEAIKRMAKAIWETGYNKVLNISFDKLKTESHKSKSKTFGNFYKLTMERAEAALNAILGDDE